MSSKPTTYKCSERERDRKREIEREMQKKRGKVIDGLIKVDSYVNKEREREGGAEKERESDRWIDEGR